jgi:hypothetical protein
MRKIYAEFENPDDLNGDKNVAFGITPDLADAIRDSIGNVRTVEPPRYAETFDDLNETISQTSRLIQHLETFRELAIVAADSTGPYADRKAIAMAAGFPPSRLYRVLEKHGRPKDRRTAVLPDIDRLQQAVNNMRNALAGKHISRDQRERIEQALPKLEAEIADIRAAQTADHSAEK